MLKDPKYLHTGSVRKESSIAALGNLAQQVPQVVPPYKVSALMDEITFISMEELSCTPHERLDDVWQHIFSLMSKESSAKYPLIIKFIKALLSLAYGNVDIERGFSENHCLLHERRKLSITSVNCLRTSRSFCNRYGQNASTVHVKPHMIKALKSSFKRYQDRLSAESGPAAKWTCSQESQAHSQDPLETKAKEQLNIHMEIDFAQKMLANAELLIAK